MTEELVRIPSKAEDGNYFQKLLDKSDTTMQPSLQNFCINLVLPLGVTQTSVKEAKEILKEESVMAFYGRNIADDTQMIGGSSTDGLALPEITHMEGTKTFVEMQDEDVLYLIAYRNIDPNHRRAFARPIPIQNRPGYVHLHFNSGWIEKRPLSCYKKYEHNEINFRSPEEYVDEEGYVLRAKLMRKLRKDMRDLIHSPEKETDLVNIHCGKYSSVQYSCHGPALTAEVFEHKYQILRSKDYVIALPHPSWPEQATRWSTRQRLWPPSDVVRSAIKQGCHVVPKAHKTSSDPREFNLSFGLASRTVAHALNISQFRCYKLFKYLFRFHITRAKRGLSTFHCKQTMFWTCEKSRQEDWREDNPFECLQWLLQQLETFLDNHNLPDYFIEDNNTIDHISKRSITAIRNAVHKVQDTCWHIILELTDSKRFPWLSKDISLLSLLSPCLSEVSLTKQAMTAMVLQYAVQLLDKGEIFLVLHLIGVDSNHRDWLNQTLITLDKVLAMNLDQDISSCLNGFQAILYCEKAVEMQQADKNDEYKALIDRCKRHFLVALNDVGSHTWIYGEYFNYLSAIKDHWKLVKHFASHVLPNTRSRTCPLYQGGIYTAVNAHNRLTTDFCIRESMLDFQTPTTAYLFFKVIQALLNLHCLENGSDAYYLKTASKCLKYFDVWAQYKFSSYPEVKDDHIHVLLAYCYDGVDQHKRSEKYFRLAESYGMDYKEESDWLMLTEPVLTRLRQTAQEQRMLRRKPYERLSRKKCSRKPNKIKLKFCEVRVNPFIHY